MGTTTATTDTADQQPQAIRTLGIVGAGLMGKGIAQIAIQGGIEVRLFDTRQGAGEQARAEIAAMLQKLADKGKLPAADVPATIARLKVAGALREFAACDAVIEAVVENLEVKKTLFAQLEEIVSAQCVLATNTSSLSVTSIAAGCQHPARVAGFHFFSPVPLMKIVEVVTGALTRPDVADRLTALARQMGHTPVSASDTPGFIVNHAGRGYPTEALRILGERIAPVADIDRVLKQAAAFRMGPFELLDLTGLDVSQPVMESIYEQYYQEPRFRPSPIGRLRMSAGLLGRKSKQGFYTYVDGKKQDAPAAAVPARSDRSVWLCADDAKAFPELVALLQSLKITLETGAATPSAGAICLVLPVGHDVSTTAVQRGLDARRTIGLDPLFFTGCRTLMRTPLTQADVRDAMHAMLAADGCDVITIDDSPGFICQRVVASVVNIGCDIAQQGVATPQDIDRAVTLGLGYPRGPLAMGDALGARRVLDILDALYSFYRDPRYRPSP
ncbi:MAG: 3-hydroxyacyl-CoA dehydrogenase, partial [Burkholderiaceae bacterium]|nr:3-hydroxyacyl-CoA dehydrogenase [Burkholderiaceae bacterium]